MTDPQPPEPPQLADAAQPQSAELSESALGLRRAVVEAEGHASEAGWDQPGRLFALVLTAELAEAEPELAAELGASDGTASLFTLVEQELEDQAESLEELLGRISWPETVAGTLAVVERVVLPPEVEDDVPDDPEAAAQFAAEHPQREDVRIAVAVLRTGETHCVVRMRAHDSDDALLHGTDIVPTLVLALRETLADE